MMAPSLNNLVAVVVRGGEGGEGLRREDDAVSLLLHCMFIQSYGVKLKSREGSLV